MTFFLFNLFSSKKKFNRNTDLREIQPDFRIERFRMVRARKSAPSNSSVKMTPKAAAAIIQQSKNMIKDIDRLENMSDSTDSRTFIPPGS
jgi:hypothetical protein